MFYGRGRTSGSPLRTMSYALRRRVFVWRGKGDGMAFSYEEDLEIERDFVRFWTGDTVEGEHFLSDEIIASLLTVEGTRQKATLAALRSIISQLSKPNFRADWLQV